MHLTKHECNETHWKGYYSFIIDVNKLLTTFNTNIQDIANIL